MLSQISSGISVRAWASSADPTSLRRGCDKRLGELVERAFGRPHRVDAPFGVSGKERPVAGDPVGNAGPQIGNRYGVIGLVAVSNRYPEFLPHPYRDLPK